MKVFFLGTFHIYSTFLHQAMTDENATLIQFFSLEHVSKHCHIIFNDYSSIKFNILSLKTAGKFLYRITGYG